MQKFVRGLVVAAAMALSAPVVAAPVIGQAGLAAAVDSGMVEHVADGCGAGWHRGPAGRCRPNRAVVVTPPVVVAPPVVVVPGPRWCHRPYSSRNFRC